MCPVVPYQAVVIRENGPAENLLYEEGFPTPKPQDGQVLVKNEYTGINFIDTYFRKGGPAYTQALPFISGQVRTAPRQASHSTSSPTR